MSKQATQLLLFYMQVTVYKNSWNNHNNNTLTIASAHKHSAKLRDTGHRMC